MHEVGRLSSKSCRYSRAKDASPRRSRLKARRHSSSSPRKRGDTFFIVKPTAAAKAQASSGEA